MHGISSRSAGKLQNRKGYNGNELQSKEFSDGSGLDLYDFNARTYDQQLGRFIQIDPMSDEEDQESFTPYHFGFNNPILHNDPDGKFPIVPIGLGLWRAYKLIRSGQNISRILRSGSSDTRAPGQIFVPVHSIKPLASIKESLTSLSNAIKEIKAGQQSGEVNNVETDKKVPNPNGAKGKPDHQEKVDELAKKADRELQPGETVVRERKIQNSNSNRRPDVQIVDKDGKTRKVFEAERRPNSQRNINREKEYKKLDIEQETHKVGKN